MYVDVVKIFIGSPGGLEGERKTAKRIIDEINQSHGEHWGIQFKLEGWELTLPGYARAQSLINKDLDKSDFFVGILWDHWGTRPGDKESSYSSGFEEEFERARTRYKGGFIKDIFLFFKNVTADKLRDPGPSLQKVIKFKEERISEKNILFKEFENNNEFESMFRAIVEKIGWDRYHAAKGEVEKERADNLGDHGSLKFGSDTAQTTSLIQGSASKFLEEIIQRSDEWESTSAAEIARIRLIGLSVYRTGNDTAYVGTHDSNLLYIVKDDTEFSSAEVHALIDSALYHIGHENQPLWYWLSLPAHTTVPFWRVWYRSLFAEGIIRKNAIDVLRVCDVNIADFSDMLSAQQVLSIWFGSDRGTEEMNAAVKYLKFINRGVEVLDLINTLDNVPPDHCNFIEKVIIYRSFQESVHSGLASLIKYDPDQVDFETVELIRSLIDAISSDDLAKLVEMKSGTIRQIAAAALEARSAVSIELANNLLTDGDVAVRLIAIQSLSRLGQPVSEENIRKALIGKQKGGLFGVLGTVSSENRAFENYKLERLKNQSLDELRKLERDSSILDTLEITALYQRYGRRCAKEIRENLSDGFRSFFNEKMKKIDDAEGSSFLLRSRAERLEDNYKKDLISMALSVLCKLKVKEDLQLIRDVIDGADIWYSDDVLEFFAKFGDWEDIGRLIAYRRRPKKGQYVSLVFNNEEEVSEVTKVIYKIGKSRIVDLFHSLNDTRVRSALYLTISKREFLALPEHQIIGDLGDDNGDLRKSVAMRCAECFGKKRNKNLLRTYASSGENYYYNSVHWLDLGAYMDSSTVSSVIRSHKES